MNTDGISPPPLSLYAAVQEELNVSATLQANQVLGRIIGAGGHGRVASTGRPSVEKQAKLFPDCI